MVVGPPTIEWRQLSGAAQETLRWAAAIEVAGQVGTRGLLVGTVRALGRQSELDQLLSHFGVPLPRLFDGLRAARPQVAIDPDVKAPAKLTDLPTLTRNGLGAVRAALERAEQLGESVDEAHLFGGMLSLPQCTAYTVLDRTLAPNVQLAVIAQAYGEYLQARHSTTFADFLRARIPHPARRPREFGGLPITPTVSAVVDGLPDPVTAGAIAADVLARHPEYGGGGARRIQIDRDAGLARTAEDWFKSLSGLLLPSPPPLLHGRLLVVALARLDPVLREQLSVDGFLAALESEIREPVDELFWSLAKQESDRRRAEAERLEALSLTPSTREVVAYAAAMAETGADADTDGGLARAAVLFGALQYATGNTAPTTANALLAEVLGDATDPQPRLDGAAAALQMERVPTPRRIPIADIAAKLEPLAEVLLRADELRKRTDAEHIHLRHLLAEALTLAPPTVPRPMFTALGVSLPTLRGVLRRAVARFVPDEPPEAWDAALADAPDSFDLAGGVSRDAVDPTRGIALKDDHLGVSTYVAMLAAVIADSRTPEPLSIGLFGEWGSGKSYFMGLLREQVEQLSRHGPPYCRGIRQIGFNAWHYADTNIWASLGDEIFEQLAGPGESVDEQRDRLRAELAGRLQRRKELQAATERAQEETKRLSEALEKASAERRSSAADLVKAAARSKTLQAQLDKAWERIGIDDPVAQGRLLGDEVRGTAAEVDTLRQVVKGRRGTVLLFMAAVTLLLVVAGIAAPTLQRWLSGSGIAALAVLLSTALTYVVRVRSGLRLLRVATSDITKTLDAQEQEAVQTRLDELRQAEARERVLQAQHDQVVERIGELGRELAELSPGQRLYQFVTERAGSEEYRRHLGLISTVRKDFEQLVGLLKDWREHGDEDTEAVRVDRIVLYIDDLDRCSPQQVVEVLQAVHLLLALDLFVVVVGVDPRWLLRSLQSEYDRVLTSDGDERGDEWQASPHDYLEKIFNIPFALPRMNARSFQSLLESFTGELSSSHDTTPARTDGTSATATTLEPPPESAEPTGEDKSDQSDGAPHVQVALIAAEEHSEAATASGGAEPIEVRPLTKPELQLLASLAPLVETPREAKRLVNLYRLVRSTRNLRPASRFLGDEERPGEYEAVVILLGLLSGHGRLLEDVLAAVPANGSRGGLVHRDPTSSWSDFAGGLEPHESDGVWGNDVVARIDSDDVEQWRRLHVGLTEASKLVTLRHLEAFQFWAPRIARFSFLLSPYVAESAETR